MIARENLDEEKLAPFGITDADLEELEAKETEYAKKVIPSLIAESINKKKYSKCESLCQEYLSKYGNDKNVSLFLALALAGQGKIEDGLLLAKDILEKNPNDNDAQRAFSVLQQLTSRGQ
ncbi:MAG: hypothetical protein AB1422_10075 [bacterium]